ncbi:hypothetical protein [Devosia chinhatensis]|nr:hypothetical protein [Devosia chinhatensis]
MSITVIVAAVLLIFATFASALGYAQLQTHGLAAPGARKAD